MNINKKELFPITLVILSFIIAFLLYPQMPSRMPIHWNAAGQIDGYGSRFIGLFLTPLILLFIYGLFYFIPKIAVFKQNIKKFYKYFHGFKLAFVLFMFVLYIATLLPNFGINLNMSFLIMPAIAALFFYIGHIMPFMKRNFFMGIRTPWTLSNDKVWEKTHKLGGTMFKWFALISLVAMFFPRYFLWIFLLPLLLGVVYLFVYSYRLYQKETKASKKKK